MSHSTRNKVALGSLAVAALVASQGALAHTRLDVPTVPEATRVRNSVIISHGCPGVIVNGTTLSRNPTYGTSVVFPNAISYTPIIGVDSGAGKVYTTDPASSFYSPLAGIGTLLRDGGPFPNIGIKTDALGNHDGFYAYGKSYDQRISTPIAVDFRSAAVTINPASCARSVTFVAAIADFCNNINTPGAVANDTQILYWSPIPNFTGVPGQPFGTSGATGTTKNGLTVGSAAYSLYDGYSDTAHTLPGDGWGSPATLKITRVSALPATGCTGNGGLGDDVYVYPSAEQINAELPIKQNTWYKAK
jgi:hypothetical protein